jgi:uncharacterized protein CbrC (UPF0167 family)
MAITFAQLGIPFPFFDAPAEQATEYCGIQTCSLCNHEGRHCFALDIGCALILPCSRCGESNGLDAAERTSVSCRVCSANIPFPNLGGGKEIMACYQCLRMGKAAITKDTELGMISWEQAFKGVTHGRPGLTHPYFELVPRGGGWIGVRLPQSMMYELLRTPTYNTIQSDLWQFCCRQPMIFIGEWSREDFQRRSPNGDGRQFFHEIVQDAIPGLWEDELHDITGIYVFRCPQCERLTAHWDIA